MKHDWKTSLKLVGWFLYAVVIGLVMVPYLRPLVGAGVGGLKEGVLIAVVLLALVVLGAFFWLRLMRYRFEKVIAVAYAMTVGTAFWMLVEMMADWRVALFVFFFVWFVQYEIIGVLRREGRGELFQIALLLNNMFQGLMVGMVGAMVGITVAPWVAMFILFLLAVYDAWMVWKSGKMIELANGLVKRGVLPVFAVLKKESGNLAMIGGGDAFCVIMVGASFLRWMSVWSTVSAVVGMLFGLLYLIFFGRKDVSYPALPFIFLGLFAGWFGGLAIRSAIIG